MAPCRALTGGCGQVGLASSAVLAETGQRKSAQAETREIQIRYYKNIFPCWGAQALE